MNKNYIFFFILLASFVTCCSSKNLEIEVFSKKFNWHTGKKVFIVGDLNNDSVENNKFLTYKGMVAKVLSNNGYEIVNTMDSAN